MFQPGANILEQGSTDNEELVILCAGQAVATVDGAIAIGSMSSASSSYRQSSRHNSRRP